MKILLLNVEAKYIMLLTRYSNPTKSETMDVLLFYIVLKRGGEIEIKVANILIGRHVLNLEILQCITKLVLL